MACKRSPGFFKGVLYEGNKIVSVESNVSCKSWRCPDCAPKKVTEVKKRISRGSISAHQQNRNHVKLTTLTCPGSAFRDQYTPSEALEMMSSAFHQVVTLLKRKYGEFEYLKVTEPQSDGYPHYHVLMVGKNIAPKAIRDTIEELWVDRYGMGFIRINIVRDHKHGVNYILKYLFKGMEPIRKYARVFSSSRSALSPPHDAGLPWIQTKFYYGRVGVDQTEEIEITPSQDNYEFLREYANRLISLTPPTPTP